MRENHGVRGALGVLLRRLPVIVVCAFFLAPLVVVVVSSFNSQNDFHFPPRGFSLRWYKAALSDPDWLGSILFSFGLLAIVVPVTLVLGTLAGYTVGVGRSRLSRVLGGFFLSPLMVPGVMVGLALLHQLQALHIVGTFWGIVIAHTVVTLPFCVRVVAVSAGGIGPGLDDAARSLGSSRLRAFLTVDLPLMRRGIVAGAVLASAISLGEVAVSVFVAGVDAVPIPVRIYSAVQVEPDPIVSAVSTLLLVFSTVVIVLLDRFAKISFLA